MDKIYTLDFTKIHTLQDIKFILEGLNIKITEENSDCEILKDYLKE